MTHRSTTWPNAVLTFSTGPDGGPLATVVTVEPLFQHARADRDYMSQFTSGDGLVSEALEALERLAAHAAGVEVEVSDEEPGRGHVAFTASFPVPDEAAESGWEAARPLLEWVQEGWYSATPGPVFRDVRDAMDDAEDSDSDEDD